MNLEVLYTTSYGSAEWYSKDLANDLTICTNTKQTVWNKNCAHTNNNKLIIHTEAKDSHSTTLGLF